MNYGDFLSFNDIVLGWSITLGLLVTTLMFAVRYPQLRLPLAIATAARLIFVVYNTHLNTLSVDAFEARANYASSFGWDQIGIDFGPNAKLYRFFCTVVYLIIGRNPIVLQGINVFLTLWSIILAARVTGTLGGPRAERIVAWLISLLPTSIIFSTVILREAVVIFPIVLGIYFWSRALRRFGPIYHLLTLLCFLVAFAFHYGCVALLFAWAIMPVVAQFRARQNLGARLGLAIASGVVSAGFVAVLYFSGVVDALMPKADLAELSAESLGEGLQTAARSRAAYLENLTISSPLDVLWQLPIRMVYFLLTPFPWMWSAFVDAFGVLDLSVYLVMLVICYRGRRVWMNSRELSSILLCFVTCVAVFSFGTSNYGTAIRHRAKFMPMLAIVAVVTWTRRQQEFAYRAMMHGAPRHGIVSQTAISKKSLPRTLA